MKTKKRRLESLSFYDHTGIEKHLSKMAQKGWMIEQISNQYWTYRRIEPKNLQFSVTYFASASDFDPGPSDKQQGFYDFCTRTGWELACSWFQMQIFYNTTDNPVPIDTDPVYEVETIHKGCKANYLKGYWFLFIIGLIEFYFLISGVIGHTLHLLSSTSNMFLGLCGTLLFLLSTVELICYYSWHKKAKKEAENGIFLDTPSTTTFQNVILCILGVGILFWGVDLIFGQKMLMFWIAILVFSAIFGTKLLTNQVKQALKKKKVSATLNRVLTVFTSFVIAVGLMSVALTAGTLLSRHEAFKDTFVLQESPLFIEDLMDPNYTDYITENNEGSSLLVSRYGIHQRHGFDDEASPEIPEMEYVIYTVKVPGMLSFCENQLKRTSLLSHEKEASHISIDASLWNADAVYQVRDQNGTPLPHYILIYDNHLIEIEFTWDLTEDQIRCISLKFGSALR